MADDILQTDRFLFFWRGWPSQWAKGTFVVDGVAYNCAEQFMMAEKARVFGDSLRIRLILEATSPRIQKQLGREVQNYDERVWNSICRRVVYAGNLARFSQSRELSVLLLATGERTIAEASPEDARWGIGLRSIDPRAHDPAQWRGTNWLGVALMQVRETIRAEREGRPARLPDELNEQLEERIALDVQGRT